MKPLIAVLLLAPSLALASEDNYAQCRFDTECLEGEACASTDYQMTVIHNDTFGFIMQSPTGNIEGFAFDNGAPDHVSTLLGQTKTAAHLLTIQPDSAARYTVHLQGPMLINYLGKCEITE